MKREGKEGDEKRRIEGDEKRRIEGDEKRRDRRE